MKSLFYKGCIKGLEADIVQHSKEEKTEKLWRCVLECNLTEEKSGEKPRQHIEELCPGGHHISSAIEHKDGHRAHLDKEKVQNAGRTKFNPRQLCVGEIKNKRRPGHTYAGSHNAR